MDSHVGIKAIEVYIPSRCIEMATLAAADGIDAGKYTIGLGQVRMSFCGDREDVCSMSLTVVQRLMEKHNIDPHTIGRVEVGTETIIDHSKSVKTVLMPLFGDHHRIRGCDCINACYGGTNALFNALDWAARTGGHAIVVATDIAVYHEKSSRPTGGAGAVALLVGPDAPLALEGSIADFSEHVYDFYKPNLSSEYPEVDGHFSLECYLRALDRCYVDFCAQNGHILGPDPITAASFDHFVFHSPYNKMVQKAFARLLYLDRKRLHNADGQPYVHPALAKFDGLSEHDSYYNADLPKACATLAAPLYDIKVAPSTLLPRHSGNSYTASIYHALASLLESAVGGPAALLGKRIVFYSYGSGSCAAMWMMRVRAPIDKLVESLGVRALINAQVCAPMDAYAEAMAQRERAVGCPVPWTPTEPLDHIAPGVYYLESISEKHHRKYARKL